MRARHITTAGRLAAVVAGLLACAGIAQAAGVRLATLPGSVGGGFAAPAARTPAGGQPASAGGARGAGAVITRATRRRKPIAAVPAVRTIGPGARTTFLIRIRPARTVRSYRLKLGRAPAGVRLRLNHRRTRRLARLTVSTAPGIRTGRYVLRISASPRRRPGAPRDRRVLRTTMTLVVAAPASGPTPPTPPASGPPAPGTLAAAGDVVQPLAPGVTRPVRVVLSNSSASAVDITTVAVTVVSVTPLPGGTCTTADFVTAPAALAAPLRLPAGTSATLEALGLPSAAWPAVTMIDRPVSQDGCKGAALALRFDVQGREPT